MVLDASKRTYEKINLSCKMHGMSETSVQWGGHSTYFAIISVAVLNPTNTTTTARSVERRHPEYSFAPICDVSGSDQSPIRSANLTNIVQRYFLCPVMISHSN